ncbi:hypothetical protein [Oceanospirillum sediminis]|uniref:Peptidase C-terminal archaeal/bacterial domain-containing protein n=1 Tax=Oceanospirillum sediminis TaxID=2760088 RepID=A0A839IN93_9GAMM|nr:hypothetical protein [Oceanospirillum sediminis]MBB1486164.1 hypothetical protein [Oceanospirillum sediminis]
MASAEELLAQYNVSMDTARAFITGNIDKPHEIYKTCAEFGISFKMIAEILNSDITENDVIDFFLTKGMVVSESTPVWSEAYRTGDYTQMYWSDFQQDDHWDVADGGATVIQLNTPYNGRFEYQQDKDVFSIQLDAGQKYTLTTINHTDFNGADDETFTATINRDDGLYGELVDTVLAIGGQTTSYTFETTASGRYFIEALGSVSHDGITNTYGLQVNQAVDNDDHSDFLDNSATDINIGQTVSGVIDLNGDKDVFELQLNAGQSYTLSIDNPVNGNEALDALETLLVTVEMQKAGETEFVARSIVLQSFSNSVSFQAEQTGQYYVVVKNMLDSAGDSDNGGNPYSFNVAQSAHNLSVSGIAEADAFI